MDVVDKLERLHLIFNNRGVPNDHVAACLREGVAEIEHLRAENARLREGLADAVVCVSDWSAYASEYFTTKHDLAGDLARLRAYLEPQK